MRATRGQGAGEELDRVPCQRSEDDLGARGAVEARAVLDTTARP
jgi:hypothetical protein